MRDRLRAAAAAPEGKDGEGARRAFRLLAVPCLERGTEEIVGEIEVRIESPHERIASIALEEDPARREERYSRWEADEREIEPLRRSLDEARRQRVAEAGAADVPSFLSAAEPVPARAIVGGMERGAVAPLDERIGAGALARRARFRPTLHGAPHASEVPALRLLTDHAERIPRERLLPILDALATATSMIGVQLFSSRVPLAHSLVLEGLGTQAGLVIGSLAGAGALVSSLAAFGRAIRATAVAEGEEAGAAGPADPAFASAVEAVFSRLALSEPFCRWAGIPTDPDFTSDLRFELALGPRLEWAYLSLALEGRAGAERAVLDALRRAAGRDPDWETTARTWGREVAGASALRGTVLGLLVEDRLQTRFGRQWFLDRGATRFLLECWHGEAGETAESMAGALGLGTIEPAPIVDAFRP